MKSAHRFYSTCIPILQATQLVEEEGVALVAALLPRPAIREPLAGMHTTFFSGGEALGWCALHPQTPLLEYSLPAYMGPWASRYKGMLDVPTTACHRFLSRISTLSSEHGSGLPIVVRSLSEDAELDRV